MFKLPIISQFLTAVGRAMMATGRGYKRDTTGNRGPRFKEERDDKIEFGRYHMAKHFRSYQKRYHGPGIK